MADQTKRYASQWASQFYVCAELTRRGYLVSLPLGNAKFTDIHVETPGGMDFHIDVKGLMNKNNAWIVPHIKPVPNQFYVLVYLPPDLSYPWFYVGSSESLLKLMIENKKITLEKDLKWDEHWAGFYMKDIVSYKDRWDLLPK